MTEVLLTKLMPPEEGPNLLPRERLLQSVLSGNKTKTILITAPAGYGKTVLALQLSRRLNKPLVWYHLDRKDNDPALLMQYLIAGLRRHWPEIGDRALQLTTKGDAVSKNPRFVASLIINDLIRAHANPLIVLDDYHELEENSVHSLIRELLDHLPAGVVTVITSRTAVPFSLHRQYLSGTARQINTAELCFTEDEISRLLSDRHNPQPGETIKAIADWTGGWPAALELAESLIPDGSFPAPKHCPGLGCSLYDYLASEVFNKLPPLYQDFLLESSVYEVLKPHRCNELLERKDSEAILSDLGNKLLLLTPLKGASNTYRCHQLFREFLLERLGKRRTQLQRRAGQLAQQHGEVDKAVELFLQAGFDEQAVAVLEEAGRRNLSLGRWYTVARWLEQLTDEQISDSPWLAYFRAAVEAYQGRLDEAEQWVEAAAADFSTANICEGLAECYLLQARLLRCRGRYREGMTFLDQAISIFPDQQAAERFDIILEKGLCLALSGEMITAEKLLSKALDTARKSRHYLAAAHLAETLGHLHYQQGRHALALRTYREAIRISPDQSLPGYYIQDAIPYIYRDWGELDKAMEWAQKSVKAKERFNLVETLPSAYCALSYVYFELGDYEAVEGLIRKALQIQYEHGSERYFLLLNQSLLAWCRFARGFWVEARQLLDSTLAAAEEQVDLACALTQMIVGTVLALMGSLTEAGEVLKRAEKNLLAMNFKTRLCEAYKALAFVHHATGDIKQFQKYARKFLHLGAKLHYIGNALQATADLLEPTLQFGLEHDVETIYVQQMIVASGKRSHKLLIELAEHPNPAVRQKVIAPLGELADEAALQAIMALTQDSADIVRQPALTYIYNRSVKPSANQTAYPEMNETDAPVDVKTFGSFQLFMGKKEISGWRTKKTRELLALLIHMNAPVSKERLIEELWPETDPNSGSALLRTTLYYLRRHFESEGLAGLIHHSQNLYSLKPHFCRLDYRNFEQLVNTGFREEPLHELGAGLLVKAVRLYRGDYMADPTDNTWAIPRQVRLKHLYIDTLMALANYYRARGNNRRARDYLLLLKEVDPLCEQAHRLLIQVYAALDDHQALYDEQSGFKMILQEEIGLSPAPETEALYQRLGCYQ